MISEGVNAKLKTRIIAIGGDGLSAIEMYERKTGRWTALPDMTSKRRCAAACIAGRKVIVAGGESDSMNLNTAEYLDLDGREGWVIMSSVMKEARAWFHGVLLDDGVTFLVTGGEAGEGTLSSCEQLNTTTMTWSDAPSMASARQDHSSVLYKKKAMVLGGRDINYDDLALCEAYHPRAKTWSPFPPLTQTRCLHVACVLNDRIYVCGGVVSGSWSDRCEVFDGEKWFELFSSDSSSFEIRAFHACVVWEGKVVVLGGDKESIDVYDEVENKWSLGVIPNMSTYREYLTAVSF